MTERETTRTVGRDGLIEFGNYLTSLHGEDYTFEVEGAEQRMQECSLNEAIERFEKFCAGSAELFRIKINYNDYKAGTIGYTQTEFKRRKQ